MKKFLLAAWEFVKMLLVALVIVLPVRYFLIQPFYVKGASMEPNFHDNEYLIIDEVNYRFNPPARGDIVVFKYPYDPKQFFIKRVIGLPGETVILKDGGVYIKNDQNPDGWQLKEDYLGPNVTTMVYNDDQIILGDSEYYVLGDNRLASKDSRIFGPVDKKFLIGRVVFRGWPLAKAGLIKSIQYAAN